MIKKKLVYYLLVIAIALGFALCYFNHTTHMSYSMDTMLFGINSTSNVIETKPRAISNTLGVL